MAKLVYVCLRDKSQTATAAGDVRAAVRRLRPHNLPDTEQTVLASDGIVVGIAGPSCLVSIRGTSVATGYLVDAGAWEQPGTARPDGNYALFRCDDRVVEIVTDTLASRTVWYAMTEEMFVASSSQRAIVTLLRSFDFNPSVVPWMLATGTLGPGFSWDKRIQHLPGATTLALDRSAWTLHVHTEPIRFIAEPGSAEEFERRTVERLRHVIGSAQVADPRWAMTLSGGVDSRVVLCLLQNRSGLRAVTWGLRSSLPNPINDARVAPRLARHFGLEYHYFETDLSEEPIDRVFSRFLAIGEGRTDRISAYADGFRLWGAIFDAGIRGILRGDEAFGERTVRNVADVRERAGLFLWSDFAGLRPLEQFGLPAQVIPPAFEQRVGESLATWRDRLQQQFRAPFVFGALHDLKLPYVEVNSPLLSNSLVEWTRRLPEELRTNKILLRRIAAHMIPNIRFSRVGALEPPGEIMKSPRVVEFLRDSLSGDGAGTAIPRELADYAIAGLTAARASRRRKAGRYIRLVARDWAPAWLHFRRYNAPQVPVLARNRFAFRALLVSQGTRMLVQDADSLREAHSDPRVMHSPQPALLPRASQALLRHSDVAARQGAFSRSPTGATSP